MLENLGTPEDRNFCVIVRNGMTLSPEDFAIYQEAINDPRWGNVVLAERLTKLGLKTGKDSIRRHRDKVCSCAR
jgi:hypothetical protein